jgi:hypothetical protein
MGAGLSFRQARALVGRLKPAAASAAFRTLPKQHQETCYFFLFAASPRRA